jgi:uncharacterized protein YeaO (DUF488 family)
MRGIDDAGLPRMSVEVQRAYEARGPHRGRRFLVDRLWPRGIRKDDLPLDGWLKEVAPSDALRRWFAHDPKRWAEFVRRYRAELDEHPDVWAPLRDAAERGRVVLVFGAKDEAHNNAVALRAYIEGKLPRPRERAQAHRTGAHRTAR